MPLFGMDKNGRIYEESSVSDNGKGKKKFASFSDEGSVFLGELSSSEIKARKNYQKEIKNKKIATEKAKKAKILKAKKLAVKKAKKAAKVKKITHQNLMDAINRQNALIMEGCYQSSMGYEYSDIHGSPYAGFEDEGTVVSSYGLIGNDIESSDEFGSNTMLGDDGFGFKIKIKKPKITIKKPTIKAPTTLKAVVKDVGVIAAKVATAPIALPLKAASQLPGVKEVYKGVDKVTGGTLSSVNRVVNLPVKAAKGQPISKADLLEAAMTAAKVGAIVASGGSAASIVSVGAGALKQGPLGQTTFGKNLLSVAEIAAGGMAIKDIIQQQAQAKIKSEAVSQIEKSTGMPFSLMMTAYDASKTTNSVADFSKSIGKKVGEDQLKKAGLGNTASQAVLSGNAQALGVMIKDTPNLALDKAKRDLIAQKVKLQESMKIENIRKKAMEKADKARNEISIAEKIREKIEKEANAVIKKELEKQLAKSLSDQASYQNDALKYASLSEIEGAKASVKIAAAEEGRYVDTSLLHPLARYSNPSTVFGVRG